jgi:hypothetical protein
MNHLRELLDASTIGTAATITDRDRENGHAFLARHAPSAICFFGGDTRTVPQPVIDSVLLNLPYDVCWFEFSRTEDKTSLVVCALAVMQDNRLSIDGFVRVNREWYWTVSGSVQGGFLSGNSAQLLEHDDAADNWNWWSSVIGGFVSALNCTNVDRVENVPSPKLQAARQKRGKQPLFSYWTLHLTTKSASGEPLGGTHASPRVHLRRGHPRQYAPGKYTWVQPHAVGNKSLGIVHKDYDGSGLQGAPA